MKSNPNSGSKKILQLASSFMAVAIQESVAEIHSLISLTQSRSITEVASATDFLVEPLTRFMNAATSLNLLERDSRNRYTLRLEQMNYSNKGSEVLFWLVRSAPLINLRDIDMVASACASGLIEQTTQGYRLSLEAEPFLNPASPSYMGLWIRNYERIAFRMFKKEHLLSALKTGQTQWQSTFGADVAHPFDLSKMDPTLFRDLMEGMHQANGSDGPMFTKHLDLKQVQRVLDIGGASGAWAMALAEAAPWIEAIDIYELSQAVNLYKELHHRYAADRIFPISWIGGDFFRGASEQGLYGLNKDDRYDLISLGWILHDWQDEDAIQILQRARAHLAPQGTLLLLEAILPEDRLGPTTLLDMTMLLQTGGKERTLSEFSQLLRAAGFELHQVIETSSRRQLILAGHAGAQSKFDLKDFIEQQIFPNAGLLESQASLIKSIISDLINGLRATHAGSPIHTLISNSDLELMFGASATFAFTFWQYLAALERLSNCKDWQSQNQSLWQKISTGEILCGLATTHLAKPYGSSLVGIAQDNDFVINGVAPWVTGFEIFDYLVVGFSTETEIAFAVVDFPKEKSQISLLPLTSFEGTSTVRIEFKNNLIPSSHICSQRLEGVTPPQPRPSMYLSPEIGIAERALKEARNHIDQKEHPKHEVIKQALGRIEEKIHEFKTARSRVKAPDNLPVICDLINRDAVRLLALTLGGSSVLANRLVSRLHSDTLLTDIVLQSPATIRSKIDDIGSRTYDYK